MIPDSISEALFDVTKSYWQERLGCFNVLFGFLPWKLYRRHTLLKQIQGLAGISDKRTTAEILNAVLLMTLPSQTYDEAVGRIKQAYQSTKGYKIGDTPPEVVRILMLATIAAGSLWNISRKEPPISA